MFCARRPHAFVVDFYLVNGKVSTEPERDLSMNLFCASCPPDISLRGFCVNRVVQSPSNTLSAYSINDFLA